MGSVSNGSKNAYLKVLEMFSDIGVPDDSRWLSLLLYFREMKGYSHLSDKQKTDIQTLMTETLSARKFSDDNLRRLLEDYKYTVTKPYKQQIEALLREASSIISGFQELLSARYGNIRDLEEATVSIVEEETDAKAIVKKLRGAFHSVKSMLENDMRSLEGLAFKDGLTNIGNRRAFDDFMATAVEIAEKDKKPLSLAMFDIDKFKNFNDQHGHRVGDQVLKLVAGFVGKSAVTLTKAGHTALAARYGGEEFALVVCGSAAGRIHEFAEEIRENVRQVKFVVRDKPESADENVVNLTISAGVASYRPEWAGNAQESLMDAADKALYEAKQQGRDRTMIYAPESKKGFRPAKN